MASLRLDLYQWLDYYKWNVRTLFILIIGYPAVRQYNLTSYIGDRYCSLSVCSVINNPSTVDYQLSLRLTSQTH